MKKRIFLLFLLAVTAVSLVSAQGRVITGNVTEADGNPIPGVTVYEKGTTNGTITDMNGKYQLTVPANATTLIFSFVGMQTQEIEIGGRAMIDVIMESSTVSLGEVVVTAIGISRDKKALGYAVQEVSGQSVSDSRNTNVINSLSGKVAGVTVTSSSGMAGASTFITMRGFNSITQENQPLFVIDGVPVDNSMDYSGNPDDGINNLGKGVGYSNRMIDLNPDDIQNVSVLKGGAATALYGLRAANGVVLITTKSGKVKGDSKVNVSFNSSVSFDQVNKLPGLQNSYAQGRYGEWLGPETFNRYSWGPKYDTLYWDNNIQDDGVTPYDEPYMFDKNGRIVGASAANAMQKATPYDNLGTFFQTGVSVNNSLSMAGGNDAASYYLSFSHSKTEGIIPNNTYQKYTLKMSGDTKLGRLFTVSGSANYMKSGGNRIQQASNLSGVMLGLLRTPASFDNSNGLSDPVNNPEAYLFPDGSQRSFRWGIYDNPYWTVNRNEFNDDVNRIISQATVTCAPTSWLNITYRLGNDFYIDRRKGTLAINSAEQPTGQILEDHHTNWDFNSDLIFNFKKDIKDISLNFNVGHNIFQHYHQQIYVQGDNLTIPDYYNMANASSVITRETITQKRTAAFYGDFGFGYKSMLYLNLTGRNEWSTTLPEKKNSFFFPSASLGFVFTELPALRDNKVLSFGKLRTSYAIVANDAPEYSTATYFISSYWIDGWTNGISFPFAGQTGFMNDDLLGNEDLKPERMKSFEAGTELRFFGNRLNFDLTYFYNKNEDLIIVVPLAGSSGYTAQTMNAATMENKGIEAVLGGSPVKNDKLEWTLNVNFTKIKNTVLSLADGVESVNLGGYTGSDIRAVAGMPYATIYGTQWVKDDNGNVIIDDRETIGGEANDHYGYPFLSDEEGPLGSALPDWTCGISSLLNYKGIMFSFLFDIRTGGYMWNGTRGALYSFGMHEDTEDRGSMTVFDGIKGHPVTNPDGSVTYQTSGVNDIEAIKDENWYNGLGGGFAGPIEPFIEESGWVRLREVSLAYTFDKMLEGTFIKSATLVLTGKNLWLSTPYTGIDPESSTFGASNAQGIDYFNTPNTRSYIVSLKLNF
ncbi:MAG: SusC/RagA family TonB-linked outer membrane protein [Bacteroidales bacterium]|nr:SusC/RagA family TonB-linked outer membrane protein [Bacteroidales bacterium]